MEVSSHALALHRVDAVEFDVAVFTNLGVDHLDFHRTPEAYFAAKARLFEPGRSPGRRGQHRRHPWAAAAWTQQRVPMVAVDHGRCDGPADRARRHAPGVAWHAVARAAARSPQRGQRAARRRDLPGARASVDETIAAGLAAMATVPGRFETFRDARWRRRVVVDYAHTPDALEQVLAASRDLAADRGRVTVVFGCGGDRDRSKRPLMGQVASQLADRVIVTTDNPRSEDPDAIVAQIVAGADGPVEVVADRSAAIRRRSVGRGPDDVVLVAGKGHEQGQVFATGHGAVRRP